VFHAGDLIDSSELNLLVLIDVKLLPEFFFLVAVSAIFAMLRWHILHFQSEMIRSTVEGEVLGQWRKPIYKSHLASRSDSFGIGM
jgi:hypothetical protein